MSGLMGDGAVKKLFKAAQVYGTGRYAVLLCAYVHPAAGFCPGDVLRFETLAEAETAAKDHALSWPQWCKFGYCHGCTKTGNGVARHPIVDLVPSCSDGWSIEYVKFGLPRRRA